MTTIDPRLTEINIDKLITQVGIPYITHNDISDEEIEEYIKHKIKQRIYNVNACCCYTNTYNLFRMATILKEIQINRFNYNYCKKYLYVS